MQTSIFRSAIPFVGVFALSLAVSITRVQAGNMQEALDHLERARYSEKEWHHEHALAHLEEAKQRLEESGSKAPERVEAIHQIREAVADARNDEWKGLNAHIDRAIRLVREGLTPTAAPVRTSNMRDALDWLESARHSEKEWHLDRALDKMEAAKRHLEESGSRAPERVDAIREVRLAIVAAQGHEWRRLNGHIDRAIELVRTTIREQS